MAYDDLITGGSEAALKATGKFRLEGKEYIVKDGDIVHIDRREASQERIHVALDHEMDVASGRRRDLDVRQLEEARWRWSGQHEVDRPPVR